MRAPGLFVGLFLAVIMGGMASAATKIVTASYTSGSLTGSATVTLDDSLLAPNTVINAATNSAIPVAVQSISLSFTGLGSTPTTTTYARSDLNGFNLITDGTGTITNLRFSGAANADGYAITPYFINFAQIIQKGSSASQFFTWGGVSVSAPAAATAIPTLSEWALITLALFLAGGGVLILSRREAIARLS